MTTEERRIKILQKRLRLLSEYLDRFDGEDSAPTFAQFIKSKGVTREMFIKDLPPGYTNVPASGMDNILEYALALGELLNGINNLSEMENASADGDDLRAGLIKYEGGQYIKDDCGCGCGGDDKDCGQDGGNYSGSGGEQDGESPALAYILNDSGGRFDDSMSFAASGGCGAPPLPPLFPNPSKQNNKLQRWQRKQWDKYKEKHAKWRRCRNSKKETNKKYTAAEKATRAFNITNVGMAPVRAAFLRLVEFNIFGLGSTFEKMRQDPNQSYWDGIAKKWFIIGGDQRKLDQNTSIGRNKKPIFKPKGWKPKGGSNADGAVYNADGDNGVWYYGEGWTAAGIAALIVAASGIVTSMAPVIKSFKKDKGEPELDFDGTPDPNRDGETPEGPAPEGDPTEGLSTGAWIGISVGAALVLGLIGYVAFKK